MRRSRTLNSFVRAVTMISALASASTAGLAYIPDGYWTLRTPGEYEEFIRIEGGGGFNCILDDKSSFRFTVIGDSITTPMNGKDAIVWFPGSGDIQISGEEKGEPYSTRYKLSDSATYAAKCRDEEARIPVSLAGRTSRPNPATIRPESARNVLGRQVKPREIWIPVKKK